MWILPDLPHLLSVLRLQRTMCPINHFFISILFIQATQNSSEFPIREKSLLPGLSELVTSFFYTHLVTSSHMIIVSSAQLIIFVNIELFGGGRGVGIKMPSTDILGYSSMLSFLFLPLVMKFLKAVLNNWVSLSFNIWENARLTLVHEWKKTLRCSPHIFPLPASSKTAAKRVLFQYFRDPFSFFVQRGHTFLHGLTIIHYIMQKKISF